MKLKQGKRPLCKCGNICTDSGNKTKNGFIIYKTICCSCKRAKYNLKSGNRKMGYTVHKKNECKLCGFIPVHSCQLDVDHIDGNKDNSDINNLQTLCANCHRLKTHLTKPCYNKKGAN
jgi:5-methylcytosine-specific restriction endonuclease McrA